MCESAEKNKRKQKKTTTTKNTGKIKALCDFFFFPWAAEDFLDSLSSSFPFKDESIFAVFWRHLFDAKQWHGSLGGEVSANPTSCCTNQALQEDLPRVLGSCLREQPSSERKSFLLSPFLSPSTFQWEPFSHSTYFWLTQISSKTWVMPKMGYSYSFTRLYASLLS